MLDSAGFTSVVATNCDQDYMRPLVLGDVLTVSSVIDSVSPEKHTGLGDGHFVTTLLDFTDQHGDTVAAMRFRVLSFRPRPAAAGTAPGALGTDAEPAALRPRPAITHDNAFFFEGARHGQVLVQRCTACATLRHPPRPACPSCGSLEWDTVDGVGPRHGLQLCGGAPSPGARFDYPLPIAVVELEEGTRLVADLVGVDPADVRIGMPVVAELVAVDGELTLPMFRPAPAAAGAAAGPGGGRNGLRLHRGAAGGVGGGCRRGGRHGRGRARGRGRGHPGPLRRRPVGRAGAPNLLGLAVPEEHGGSGLGLTEVCLVLEQQGRFVAPVPLWATVVLGAMPVTRFGTPEQCRRWLPAVVAGDTRLSAAVAEVARSARAAPSSPPSATGPDGVCRAPSTACPRRTSPSGSSSPPPPAAPTPATG